MIVRRVFWVFLLVCGAISGSSAIAPCPCAVPSSDAPVQATQDKSAGHSARLVWKTGGNDRARSWVELHDLDTVLLSTVNAPAMTTSRWNSIFWVHVVPEGKPASRDQPPVLGSYQVTGHVVRFQPRFGLEPGIRFRAEFDPDALKKVVAELSPPGEATRQKLDLLAKLTREWSAWSHPIHPAQPTAKLAEVYPSSAELPENLLRFYLHFSAPMSRGEAYRHISLVNVATGKPVDSPFLELDEELWSSDGTRFTLVFDPGRIKRGIKPREELGPVLEAGKSYLLVVDRDWPDAQGTPLRSEFRKPFRVGPPDETSPDPRTWRIDAPRSDTIDPLTVRLQEPLDRALLDRLIAVHDATGKVVPGRRSISSGETIWRFTPEAVWRPGEYRLVVGTDLEDRAGNSVARPFEVDLAGPISKQIKSETIALPFRIAR